MTWDHPQSAWICETAEILAGFDLPASEGTRRLLWAAAGLPRGRPAAPGSRSARKERDRAEAMNAEAVAGLREACVTSARLADEGKTPADRERRQAAATLLADAESELREELDLPE